jgi:glycosyltransferase involved in cell wall biosynthesis
MVGHVYSTAFNRRKLNPLTAMFELTCVTLPRERSAVLGKPQLDCDDDHEPAYELVRLPQWPKTGAITRYVHRGLHQILRSRRFDMVLVDSEPWSWIRWQCWALARGIQPQALFGEFTWENVKRPGLKGILLGVIYRLACRTQDFSIAGNQACRQILLEYGARAETNLVAAQIGVDMEEFRPADAEEKQRLRARQGLDPDAFLVGFCGRLTASKGVRELVRGVEALRARVPGKEVHLALLGAGDLGRELASQAESRPWLRVLSPRPHHEVAPFMRCLDLFVLPSQPVRSGPGLWEEQFGHVLIEAMAAGVLTLGSRSGAIPEVIGFEEALFEAADADAITGALMHWVGRDLPRKALAERQLGRMRACYSHEALAQTWGQFLLQQLQRQRSQPLAGQGVPDSLSRPITR